MVPGDPWVPYQSCGVHLGHSGQQLIRAGPSCRKKKWSCPSHWSCHSKWNQYILQTMSLWGSIVMMKGNHIRHWPKTKSLAFEEAHFDYDKGGNNFGLSWRTAPNKVGWRSMLQTQKKSGYSPVISPTFACLGLVLLFLIVSRRSCVQMWLWICRRANCPFGMFFGLNPNQQCSCCRTSIIRHQYQNWCFSQPSTSEKTHTEVSREISCHGLCWGQSQCRQRSGG